VKNSKKVLETIGSSSWPPHANVEKYIMSIRDEVLKTDLQERYLETYEDYKKNENNYDLCFMWIKDDYEYNRIRKNYTFYIQVIKDCKNIT
jgi:hypothetical protein